MPVFQEPVHAGEHLVSEANGNRSRSVVSVSGGNYSAATVLGQEAAGNQEYKQLDPDAADGTEVAKAVLFAPTDASTGAVAATVHDRDCEVNGLVLVWPDGILEAEKTAAIDQLKTVGVIVRS